MTQVQIVMPTGALGASASDDFLDTAMRVIAVGFAQPDEWASKYGTDYENDIFMMHHYCWCDSTDCPWCAGCACKTDDDEAKCDWCSDVHKWADKGALPPNKHPHLGAPHFWFKPSGFRLWWYKYIGRGMEVAGGSLPGDFLQQIFATHPKAMTVDQAMEELARGEEENAKAFRAMFDSHGVQHL